MIKEWCEKCFGRGQYLMGNEKLTECVNCKGFGYTELEAAIVGDNNDIEVFAQLDLRSNGQWEVYIKEVKEDKK